MGLTQLHKPLLALSPAPGLFFYSELIPVNSRGFQAQEVRMERMSWLTIQTAVLGWAEPTAPVTVFYGHESSSPQNAGLVS